MKKLWILLISIFIFSFCILGWVGAEIFRQAPPIPKEVVTSEGAILFTGTEISDGQNVWQAMGGMQVGSIWAMAAMSRPIGPRIIFTVRRSLSLMNGRKANFRAARYPPNNRLP